MYPSDAKRPAATTYRLLYYIMYDNLAFVPPRANGKTALILMCSRDPRDRRDRRSSGSRLSAPNLRPPTSPMAKHYSKYQQRIIKNYYDNREAISLQRLSELVTDLYLAEGKARATKWKQVTAALEKLGLSEDRIEHLRKQDNPALLAKVVEEMMEKG